MKHIGRIVGLVVMLFILIVTPCAFWSFNISRVAMDPQTYKGALKSQNFYSSLLPALVDLAANQSPDPVIKDAARSLTKAMTPEDWAGVENSLLPSNWLETQLNQNIDHLFQWLDGSTDSPNIQLDLKDLKDKLSSADVSSVSQIIVPKLPTCTSDQQQAFKATSDSTAPTSAPPICNPGKELQPVAETKLSQIFNSIGANLPPVWRLSDALQRAAASAQRGPNAPPPPVDMNRVRAFIWLDNRFVALLFLIPLGLFAIIMMVTIR